MQDLVALYGNLPAKDFDPLRLKAVREKLIQRGWGRKTRAAGIAR
jgi:hypothetical protein